MSKPTCVLIIGHVWPEPDSTAAGSRMLQLIQLMLAENWNIYFTSAAQKSEFSANLVQLGVVEKECQLNNNNFQRWVGEINPHIVIYDRFLTEEQFGWRVRESAPSSLQVLDTEDLHFLRKAREEAVKQGLQASQAYLYTELAKREIGAMLRCDLNLMISEVEIQLLQSKFNFLESQLFYLPFLVDSSVVKEDKTYAHRKNLVSIGNFLHAPNWDQVRFLKTEIWPTLRKKLPGVELHIYGAYTSEKVRQLHQPKEGFIVKGRATDLNKTLENYRLLLAPLRFGAGLKGKIVDAFINGTPVITSAIGAEGMTSKQLSWPGAIEDKPQAFVEQTALIYQDQEKWQEASKRCRLLVEQKFDVSNYAKSFIHRLGFLNDNVKLHREQHFISQVFSQHQLNAQKFMSLWIEEKNKFTRK